MKTLKDINLSNKRVLIRCDFNVPLDENQTITDDTRIKEFVPTLKKITEAGGIPILMSHMGSPDGARDEKLSLKPAAIRLTELSGISVKLAPDCIGSSADEAVKGLEPGQALLLENLRFHPGEEANDPEFAKNLAKHGEVYVNDAFATCHRKHASMVTVPKLFSERVAGLLVEKELTFYEKSLVKPKRPLCVVLGGSKISTKLDALKQVQHLADTLIIGGAMANTFLAAQGLQMGRSLIERDLYPVALEILTNLYRREAKVYLPVDFVVAPNLQSKGLSRVATSQEVPAELMALDIGPATSLLYRSAVQRCETIVWNGPMGVFEQEEFSKGTTDMVETLSQAHGLTVAGGGDTDAAIHKMELAHKFDFISTGGGAFMYLLEGKKLPAIAALE